MTDWLRRAGGGLLPDGAGVVWSVAGGDRGRRWRWTVTRDGHLESVGLIELRPSGALARLELAAPGVLVTFHPEPDEWMAHGNVVTGEGVEPIAIDWQPGWTVAIAGDPFGSAVAGWRGRGVVVGPNGITPDSDPAPTASPVDGRGVPILGVAEEWPLED